MAENEHIMTTRSKQKSRVDAADQPDTANAPSATSSKHITRSTSITNFKAPSRNIDLETNSKVYGKKPVYNPDPNSDSEDNITVSKPVTRKKQVYNPDPGSDAEDKITVAEPASTTKPRASRGKKVQGSKLLGSINDDMLGLALEDDNAPLKAQASTSKNTVTKHKSTTKKPEAPRKQKNKAQTSEHEFHEPTSPFQAPGPRATHPDYPDLPPEVPVDDEGIQ
ncbi:unnamed protein product [Aureobasidium mustum]|uniref:Uncharacterized protein n=1 Tax=Aureobasidium mustum TaxID=2773714 RepID=A0A9N8P852_9PEZI|nr:unnamed protein product [Aureobasidium mustum]